jgi:hypothetical protein
MSTRMIPTKRTNVAAALEIHGLDSNGDPARINRARQPPHFERVHTMRG